MIRYRLTVELRQMLVPAKLRPIVRHTGIFLFWAVVFGLCYTQQPLFYSNQNHRFLPGLAAAGEGYLQSDWLAGTTDPTPLFSSLVWFTHRFLDDHLFYMYYALLQAGYLLSLAWIGSANARLSNGYGPKFLLLTLLIAIHSWGARALSKWLTGTDIVWPLQSGVAGQYILGPMFQPSVIGVFLIYSIAAFLAGRPLLAILCSSIALIVHPTYLLSAALLTIAYLGLMVYEQRFRQAFGLALCALVLALPIVIYNALVFGPSDAQTFARANYILARWRFPHHCVPNQWLNGEAFAQMTLVTTSLWLVRDGRLLTILVVSLLGVLLLTSIQMVTDNDALALLFPWRSSVYLTPLALAIALGRGIAAVKACGTPWAAYATGLKATCLFLLVNLALLGGWHMLDTATALHRHRDAALFAFIRQNKAVDHVYLIPVRMERFRLATGACIFVDHKSHPYKDKQVLEWFDRLQQAEMFYQGVAEKRAEVLHDLARRYGVTHAVVGWDDLPLEEGFTEVYRDRHYRVLRISDP